MIFNNILLHDVNNTTAPQFVNNNNVNVSDNSVSHINPELHHVDNSDINNVDTLANTHTDKNSVTNSNTELHQSHNSNLNNVATSASADIPSNGEIDDDTAAEGDDYLMRINGGPQITSVLTVENPESDNNILSIAPGEGEKPLSIRCDENFEEMSNFNQCLLNTDGRFSHDLDYLFMAQYIVESKQLLDDAHSFIWRQRPHDSRITAAQARDPHCLDQYVRADKVYRFMKNVGRSPYYQRTFFDLVAMVRQLGTPTWYFTLSAADLKWPDTIQVIAKQYGTYYTDEQVKELPFEVRSSWIRRNPVAAARHFNYRLNCFFSDFLKSEVHLLGELVDYVSCEVHLMHCGLKMHQSFRLIPLKKSANLLINTSLVKCLQRKVCYKI